MTARACLFAVFVLLCVSLSGQTILQQNYDTRTYNWARVSGASSNSASADLSSAGAGKAITLRPCPWGLGTNGKAYISGGNGTAEAVAITGLVGSGGAASCVLTVTTANAHSGAYTVGSATNGIQEAVNMVPATNAGATIVMPPGILTQRATVNMVNNGIILRGSSRSGTTLRASTTDLVFFTSTGLGFANYVFEDFALEASTLTLANTSVGFQFTVMSNITWQRLVSNNVWRLFDIDRGNGYTARDIWTFGESNARFYDSTDGVDHIRWVMIDNWRAINMLSWSDQPMIYIGDSASSTIRNVVATFPDRLTRTGIVLDGHSEDMTVDTVSIIQGSIGVHARDVYFSKLDKMDISGTGLANLVCDGCYQVKITNSMFAAAASTGVGSPDMVAFINTLPVATGSNSILGCSFSGNGSYGGDGSAIRIATGMGGPLLITGNTFSNVSWTGAARGVWIQEPAFTGLSITGNTFDAEGPLDITSISNANPMVVTTSSTFAPPRTTGALVYFTGGTGDWAAINAPLYYPVTVIDGTHFSVAVNSSGFAAYGAQAIKYQAVPFDIADVAQFSGIKSIEGNSVEDRRDVPFSRSTSDHWITGRYVKQAEYPSSGSSILIDQVNLANTLTLFQYANDSSGNWAFTWPGDPTVSFNINSLNALTLNDTEVRIGNASGGTVVIPLVNLPSHADNAAATGAGLAVGTLYRTAAGAIMVRF